MAYLINKIKAMKEAILTWKDGRVFIIALVKRTDIDDKWDIVISADWIKESNNQENLVGIITLLRDKFEADLDFLSKIVLVKKNDKVIKSLVRSIIDNSITEGYIGELKLNDSFTFKEINLVHIDLEDFDVNETVTQKEMVVTTEDF